MHARMIRVQSRQFYYRSNTLFHRRADAPIASSVESREAILDPLLKDASAFPGVPYKEFNANDSATMLERISRVTLRSVDR